MTTRFLTKTELREIETRLLKRPRTAETSAAIQKIRDQIRTAPSP